MDSLPPTSAPNSGQVDLFDRLFAAVEDLERITDHPALDKIIKEQLDLSRVELREKVANLLNLAISKDQETAPIIEQENLTEDMGGLAEELFLQLSPAILNQLLLEIDRQISIIQSHHYYHAALEAYDQNDQKKLGVFLKKIGYREQFPETVFHGIQLLKPGAPEVLEKKNLLTPAQYVQQIKSILSEGLIPGGNTDSLPGLEATFVVTNPAQSHGFAGLKFLPFPEKVWQFYSAESGALQVVSPQINPTDSEGKQRFTVYLRDIRFWSYLQKHPGHTRDIFGVLNFKECQYYLKNLKAELRKEQIPFEIIYPPKI